MAVNGLTTQAWLPANAVIKMERKDTGSITTFTTLVTNFSDGGGARNIDSIAHFGDAFLVVTKPQENFQVSFDADVTDTTWTEVLNPNVTMVTGSARKGVSDGSQKSYKVKIEWLSPDTNEAFKVIFYNAKGVEYTKDSSADGRLTSKIKFELAPRDTNGSGQRYEIETRDRTNAGVGSAATGSYGSWEKTADTLFGYSPGSML